MLNLKIIAVLLLIGTGLVGCQSNSSDKGASASNQRVEVQTNPASIHVSAAK